MVSFPYREWLIKNAIFYYTMISFRPSGMSGDSRKGVA